MKNLMLTALFLIFVSCASAPETIKMDTIHGKNHNGEVVDIDNHTKNGTVVVFLSARCPCSNSNSKVVKELKAKYGEDFNFVAVHANYNERLKHAKKYFTELHLDFPVIYDPEAKLADKLGAVKTPHSFVINNKGQVVYRGGVTNSTNADKATEFYLENAINAVKEGRTPEEAKKKTLGCYIPRKENV